MIPKALLCRVMILVFVLLLRASAGWAGLSISPAYVETTLDGGRPVGEFIVSNLGEEEERYRIRAVHFSFQKDGTFKRIPPDENSLVPWIKFNPTEFTLAPKTRRAVRFVIVPAGNLRVGEYWGAMELESLKTTMGSGKDKAGREYQIEVIPAIVVPIFGKFGNVRYAGAFTGALLAGKGAGQHVQLRFSNTGGGRLWIEGDYEIVDDKGQETAKGPIGKFYVLPGSEHVSRCLLTAPLSEGHYRIRARCRSPQLQEPLTGEFLLSTRPST